MYISKHKAPLGALDRKVPRNPRYAQVRGSLDTGASASKIKHITTKEFLAKKGELFVRVCARDLAELLQAQGELESAVRDEDDAKESKSNLVKEPFRGSRAVHQGGPIGDYGRDRNVSLERAAHQREVDQEHDLLLLDLRDGQPFDACHIFSSTNYPAVNLAQDRLTPSIHRFKNKSGKLLVLYDDDERLSAPAATKLVQRGFDNVRVLTGGLRSFGNAFEHLLQGGPLPDHLVKKQVKSPTESTAERRAARRRRRLEQEVLGQEGLSTPRSGYYAGSVSGASSVISIASHRSTFSRAPRWSQDRAGAQEHRERVAKLHHTFS